MSAFANPNSAHRIKKYSSAALHSRNKKHDAYIHFTSSQNTKNRVCTAAISRNQKLSTLCHSFYMNTNLKLHPLFRRASSMLLLLRARENKRSCNLWCLHGGRHFKNHPLLKAEETAFIAFYTGMGSARER
jgi:hypothetical protein